MIIQSDQKLTQKQPIITMKIQGLILYAVLLVLLNKHLKITATPLNTTGDKIEIKNTDDETNITTPSISALRRAGSTYRIRITGDP